jgi:hypothetical protein
MPKGVCAELTGMVFGRLTVIKRLHATERGYLWLCRCTCGNEVTPATGNLTRGNTASCGCLKREMVRDKNLRHGLTVREHRTPEMDIFHAAKRRCENPNDQRYSDYGGRGIKFRFTSYEHFIQSVGMRPSTDFSIDRIDNNGHYEPGNVQWATRSAQQKNRRRSKPPKVA